MFSGEFRTIQDASWDACCYRTRFDDLLPGPLAEGAVRRCTDDTDGLDVFEDDAPGRDLDAEIAEAGWKKIF